MPARVGVILYPPTEWGDIEQFLGSSRPEGVELSVDTGSGDRGNGEIKLGALKSDDGFWFFWLNAAKGAPDPGAGNGWALFNALAQQSAGIYAMPRDAPQLREHLGRGLTTAPPADPPVFDVCRELGLVGRATVFCEALRRLARLAQYDVPVLLEGETGTGKELFARALHYLGVRRGKPFVPVNCGALPDTLLETELFGHVRGAFTDARTDVRGLVAQADGGTLFFDEVHALSPKCQVTLLRFLQDRVFRPVGSERTHRADVRIVAATNCQLERAVAEGRFREDLLYRLKVAALALPPLRERREDIPLLIEHALLRLCAQLRARPRRFDDASIAWFCGQPWHGNVRELENAVCRELLLTDGPVIRVGHGESSGSRDATSGDRCGHSFKEARARVVSEFEAEYLRAMLSRTRGNVTEAARRAGKERRVFGRLMRKHGINRSHFL